MWAIKSACSLEFSFEEKESPRVTFYTDWIETASWILLAFGRRKKPFYRATKIQNGLSSVIKKGHSARAVRAFSLLNCALFVMPTITRLRTLPREKTNYFSYSRLIANHLTNRASYAWNGHCLAYDPLIIIRFYRFFILLSIWGEYLIYATVSCRFQLKILIK